MAPLSLRFRLIALLLSLSVLAWSATAFVLYRDARQEAGALLDAQLAQTAKLVLNEAPHRLHELAEQAEDEDERDREDREDHDESDRKHQYEQDLYYQLWDNQGRLIYRLSAQVPATPMAGQAEGFHEQFVEGVRWRTYGLWNEDQSLRIHIGAPQPRRDQLLGALALRILTPIGLLVPLLAVLVGIAVGAGLSPLRRLASEIERRSPSGLEPVSDAVPAEVMPLVKAINNLFSRMGETLQREQRFTADAAHELRTPLAAVKTQTQVALGATLPAERHHALLQIQEGVDRATRLLENLLLLARLDPNVPMASVERVNLALLASEVSGKLAPAALEKHIDFELQAAENIEFEGSAALVGVLLRNLIDNAIRYSPPGARVLVTVRKTGQQAEVAVEDTGPGIPPEQRSRVFDRFYRILGNDAPGSGLGLSLVREIATLHRAEVTLGAGADGRGLRVSVLFPPC